MSCTLSSPFCDSPVVCWGCPVCRRCPRLTPRLPSPSAPPPLSSLASQLLAQWIIVLGANVLPNLGENVYKQPTSPPPSCSQQCGLYLGLEPVPSSGRWQGQTPQEKCGDSVLPNHAVLLRDWDLQSFGHTWERDLWARDRSVCQLNQQLRYRKAWGRQAAAVVTSRGWATGTVGTRRQHVLPARWVQHLVLWAEARNCHPESIYCPHEEWPRDRGQHQPAPLFSLPVSARSSVSNLISWHGRLLRPGVPRGKMQTQRTEAKSPKRVSPPFSARHSPALPSGWDPQRSVTFVFQKLPRHKSCSRQHKRAIDRPHGCKKPTFVPTPCLDTSASWCVLSWLEALIHAEPSELDAPLSTLFLLEWSAFVPALCVCFQ